MLVFVGYLVCCFGVEYDGGLVFGCVGKDVVVCVELFVQFVVVYVVGYGVDYLCFVDVVYCKIVQFFVFVVLGIQVLVVVIVGYVLWGDGVFGGFVSGVGMVFECQLFVFQYC